MFSFTTGIIVLSPQPSSAVKPLEVRLETAVTLQCDLSYHYEINWLRMSSDMNPELLMVLGLKNDGDLSVYWSSNSSSFQGFIKNRFIQLRIVRVSEADLVTYFCVAMNEKRIEFGEGMRLYGKEQDDETSHCLLVPAHRFCICFVFFSCLECATASESRSEPDTMPRLRL